MPTTRIEPVDKTHAVLALGCWAFGGQGWGRQDDSDSLDAMREALEHGMNHFDTAEAYGHGRSERLVAKAIQGRREEVFLATKGMPREATAEEMQDKLDESLRRLETDYVDLYYIHWPRKDRDMRPAMEGLEAARAAGKLRAVGVSNFSVEQMEQVSEVGRIDAHQFCYNAVWRFPEKELIPYCRENGIAVVTYSSIAQGILTGKFQLRLNFPEGDNRKGVVLFSSKVWPYVHGGVEKLKQLAEEAQRPLVHLAIRWVAAQPGVTSVLVGARNAEQVRQNAAAMTGEIDDAILARMSEISNEIVAKVPDTGNIFAWYP